MCSLIVHTSVCVCVCVRACVRAHVCVYVCVSVSECIFVHVCVFEYMHNSHSLIWWNHISLIFLFQPLSLGLDKIESLQNHSSEQIYHLAYRIIEKYFSCDDEVDSTVEPQKAEDGGNFLFNSNSNPPEGGFQF